jgi:hypothetical protein
MHSMTNMRALARCLATTSLLLLSWAAGAAPLSAPELAATFAQTIDRKLQVPQQEVQAYAQLAELAFAQAAIHPLEAQYVLVVDRNIHVQAALLLWRSAAGAYELIGASPVSTGAPGTFDHFQTPGGVFEHERSNPDFRAEGTFNENGIRGYGAKGMRVFDFGWQRVPKGWGDGAVIDMRLQLHATDPDVLEPRLGSRQSKGCIRIPASLNRLLDRYGVLDADYDQAMAEGRASWVLDAAREPVADEGRYLVVVDSGRSRRPPWSPRPVAPRPPVHAPP